jgi:hypothetical protein
VTVNSPPTIDDYSSRATREMAPGSGGWEKGKHWFPNAYKDVTASGNDMFRQNKVQNGLVPVERTPLRLHRCQ